MQRYSALVSTPMSGGHVIVDLGECESRESAENKFRAFKLCLNAEKIKIEIVETATIDPPKDCESQSGG